LLEIIGFYFTLMAKLFDKLLNAFEIMPGVSFIAFIISSLLIIMLINLIKLNFDDVSFLPDKKNKGGK